MKILFIGGTGTISMAISKQLLAEGHTLYLLNRGSRNQSLSENLIELKADINDEAAVARAKQEKLQESELLRNWPVQIKLAPVQAPYFDGANLLIAADCSAYAYASFHKDFVKGRVTLIGCPKLDVIDYSEKLTQILQNNSIASVTVVRMEVPCCGGIEYAVNRALQNSGKFIPRQVITIGIKGERKGGRADVQEY